MQGEELNRSGELFIRRNPKLKVKLVDGSSLAVAVVLNSIPKDTTQVVFRGNFNKVANSLAVALCHKGMQVININIKRNFLSICYFFYIQNKLEKIDFIYFYCEQH